MHEESEDDERPQQQVLVPYCHCLLSLICHDHPWPSFYKISICIKLSQHTTRLPHSCRL